MGRRSRARSGALGALAALGMAGCFEMPRTFTTVSLDGVRPLLGGGGIEVVEVLEPGARVAMYPGAVPWHPTANGSETPDIEAGGTLVLGADADSVFRLAAALARADHDPVYVFVPRTPEERQALVALARSGEEASLGEDS